MSNARLLETFLDLVRIDSPSGSEAAVASYCADRLTGLGFDVEFDESMRETGSDTGNLFARRPGLHGSTLILSAHMDCVAPCTGVEPVVSKGMVSSAGETVLGADDKAGIAAILTAVERLIALNEPHPDLLVVLTVSEETGLTGAKALDPTAVKGDLCLVLDADGVPGGIVIGAPTHYTFTASFNGKASHAGVAPEEGNSAIVMASRAISAMRLGRLDDGTTANIGSLNGGTATNVVPAQAFVTGECRSLDPARVEDVRLAMDQVMREAAKFGDGTVDIAWTREYVGFSSDPADDIVTLVSDACRDVGLAPRTFTTGGGSDGNIFAAAGVPTLVLSCGMQAVHSTEERLAVADLEALAALVGAVAQRMVG